MTYSWSCSIYFITYGLSHFSYVRLFATIWTVARQAPLSVGFSRWEYWSGLPLTVQWDKLCKLWLLGVRTYTVFSLVLWCSGWALGPGVEMKEGKCLLRNPSLHYTQAESANSFSLPNMVCPISLQIKPCTDLTRRNPFKGPWTCWSIYYTAS